MSNQITVSVPTPEALRPTLSTTQTSPSASQPTLISTVRPRQIRSRLSGNCEPGVILNAAFVSVSPSLPCGRQPLTRIGRQKNSPDPKVNTFPCVGGLLNKIAVPPPSCSHNCTVKPCYYRPRHLNASVSLVAHVISSAPSSLQATFETSMDVHETPWWHIVSAMASYLVGDGS